MLRVGEEMRVLRVGEKMRVLRVGDEGVMCK